MKKKVFDYLTTSMITKKSYWLWYDTFKSVHKRMQIATYNNQPIKQNYNTFDDIKHTSKLAKEEFKDNQVNVMEWLAVSQQSWK